MPDTRPVNKRPERCVIVCGAPICDYPRLRQSLRKDDFFIFCDSGLSHRNGLAVEPDLIVGDFDSHENPRMDVETIVLPCEKDDTDSMFAAKEAVRRGFSQVLLLGAAGGRLDHTLANVSILLMLDSLNIRAALADDCSLMEIVSSEAEIGCEYRFFSIIAIDGTAEGVTIEGAKYPLSSAVITPDYQYGISNEPLEGQTARVMVRRGRLLLIKVFG